MKNKNAIGLNKNEDIPMLYHFLFEYENDIKSNSGKYNFDKSEFQKFCTSNNIICKKTLAKKELDKKYKYSNYFFF